MNISTDMGTFFSRPQLLGRIQAHRWVSLIVILTAGCVLLGWRLHNTLLKSILPTLRPMNPVLAVAFVLAAWSLYLTERPSARSGAFSARQMSAAGLGLIVAAIGIFRLVAYYANWDFSIDQLLFREELALVPASLPGRMALSAAFSLSLVGFSLLMINLNWLKSYHLVQALLIVVIFVSMLALVGYIYQIRNFGGINLYIMMALHATVLFLLLGVGILWLFPQKGFLGVFLSDHLGGKLSRSLFPAVILIPLTVGWLCLALKDYLNLDNPLGVGIVVVWIMFIFSFIVYFTARMLNRIDSERKIALSDLLKQQKFLESISRATPDIILVYDLPNDKVIYFNKETTTLLGCPINQFTLSGRSQWFTELVHPDDKPRLAAFFDTLPALDDNQIGEVEFRVKDPLGQLCWLCSRSVVFARNERGEVTQVISWKQDITSEKKNEERIAQLLKEAQAANDSLLIREEEARQALSDALVLNEKWHESEMNFAEAQRITQLGSWYFERENHLLKWSDQLYRNYGLIPQEAEPSLDLFLSVVHPDERESVRYLIRHLEEYPQPHSSEIRLIRKDGVETITRMIINYRLDENQTVKTVFGTVQDITELKRAQQQVQELLKESQAANEELAASEEVLRETLDTTLELNRKLAESQLELDEAQQIAQLGRWSQNINGRQLTYSDEMYRILDIPRDPEGLKGEKFIGNYVHPDDQEAGARAIFEAVQSAKPFEMEIRLLTGRKEVRWAHVVCKPILNESGQVVRLLGTTMDITKRKLAEIALRESEDRYRKLVELLPDAILITHGGAITYTNPAAIKMFGGHRAEDLIGRLLKDHLRDHFKELIDDLSDSELAQDTAPLPFNTLTRLDGTRIDAEIDMAPLVINSEQGALILIRDITQRKKAERALLDSEQFYKAIFQNSSDFVQTINAQGEVMYQSPAFYRLTGYYAHERKGRNVLEILHPEDQEEGRKFFTLLLDKPGVSLSHQIRILHKNGSWRWIESTATNLLHKSAVGAVVVNNRDITERRLAEDQLKQQNEELKKINAELDRFVYRASHDLRAPLASLLGLISIAKDELDNAKIADYFGLMEKSVAKLDTFIQNIITYSRNARLDVNVSEIDFEGLIADAFEDMKYMNRSEEIEKRIHIDLNTPFYSDDFRIKIIFNNLISNAIRYSNPRVASFIAIRIVADANQASIELEDNGLGIAEENIGKIFEMFYRASQNNVGSGLGLYIVKEVTDALKGTIEVSSQLGSGTLFRIVLPNGAMNASE